MGNNKGNIRLSTRSALSDDIDWQLLVAGVDVQKDGDHVLVEPVSQENWQDLLDQRVRETKAFKEAGLSLPSWAIFTTK
ncbi:hypothetical protein [Rahnella inusitata]|uniref:hypothetical protein n=1 Tax=Rahnella inusitata TaxID=58169 RepID=UPI0039AEDDBC